MSWNGDSGFEPVLWPLAVGMVVGLSLCYKTSVRDADSEVDNANRIYEPATRELDTPREQEKSLTEIIQRHYQNREE